MAKMFVIVPSSLDYKDIGPKLKVKTFSAVPEKMRSFQENKCN